jgi:hypothetical protein
MEKVELGLVVTTENAENGCGFGTALRQPGLGKLSSFANH